MYGIAAANVFARALLPLVMYELGLSAIYSFWLSIAVSTILSLSALFVAIWIFSLAFATRFVRKSVSGSLWALIVRPLPAMLIFAISCVGLVTAFILFTSEFSTILFALYAVGTPFFY